MNLLKCLGSIEKANEVNRFRDKKIYNLKDHQELHKKH